MTSEIKVDTISEQTSANGVTIDGLTIKDGNIQGSPALVGTTPSFTIGDGGAEDTKIVFDGNALDYYIGLDDSADNLIIGSGSTVGSNSLITIDSDGDLTLDVAGDIILDADGGDIRFKDAGTEIAVFENSSSDLQIKASVQDKDIIFRGNDGGSGINALTLDMSDAGTALFNHNIKLNTDDGFLSSGASDDFLFVHDGTDSKIFNSTGDLIIDNSASDKDLIFKGSDGGSAITALTLDMSLAGSATFNHDIQMPDNGLLRMGAGGDLILTSDGTNGTIFANEGDLTLDTAGDIILDAADNQIFFKDAGTTVGTLSMTGADLKFISNVSDKDIIFAGTDGGSEITALTLDMSAAGKATFNAGLSITSNDITAPAATIYHDSSNRLRTVMGTAGMLFMEDGNSTAHMKIDENGAVTKPLQPCAAIELSGVVSNLTVGGASNHTIVFNSELIDQGADFNTSTGIFTCPVAGKYQVNLVLRLENIDTAANTYDFIVNTTQRNYQIRFDPDRFDSDGTFFASGSYIIFAAANDTIRVQYYQDAGTSQTDIATSSFFSTHLIA